MLSELRRVFASSRFIGCTAESVVGDGHEFEDEPATAVLAGRLPNVHIQPLPELSAGAIDLPAPPSEIAAFIVLLDPFSVRADRLTHQFNAVAPGVPVLGGVASWASSAGQNALALDDAILDRGSVGIALSGDIRVHPIVSQGCRPVGSVMRITQGQGNQIAELDGIPPLTRLREIFEAADSNTQSLMRAGILIGRSVRNDRTDVGHGSFVVRGLMGADSDSGTIAVSDRIVAGDLVQFHVRDATTARDDLELLLTGQAFEAQAAGALLFTCNGRGKRLFGEPDTDIQAVQRALGDEVPVAGFFCGGELGPIGSENFLHGFTASLAILRPREHPAVIDRKFM